MDIASADRLIFLGAQCAAKKINLSAGKLQDAWGLGTEHNPDERSAPIKTTDICS
jgi:hypothetical protein